VPGVFVAAERDGEGIGKACWKTLEIGYTDPDRIEVLSGVGPDDPVVLVGQHGLREGARVRVIEAGK
jgi:hypothetical protein